MLADSALIFLSPRDAHLAFHFPWVLCWEQEALGSRETSIWGFALSEEGATCFTCGLSQSSFEIGIMNIPLLQMRSRKIK